MQKNLEAKLWVLDTDTNKSDIELREEVMRRNGIDPKDCFISSLSCDEIKTLALTYKPNLIVLCGDDYLTGLTGKKNIHNWRGSILLSVDGNAKVIPIYWTSYVASTILSYPAYDKDWKRIREESKTAYLGFTPYTFAIDPSNSIQQYLDRILTLPIISCDIESIKDTQQILCVGFGLSSTEAIIIPWDRPYAYHFIETILTNPNIRKIFHNGTFDISILALNGIRVQGFTDDTIIQAHVLDPELPRDLGFLTSIYTRTPYYKTEGRSNIPNDTKGWSTKRNKEELYIYNGKDCCVTYEIWQVLSHDISSESLNSLYTYEMELVEAMAEMSMTGLEVDQERLKLIKTSVEYNRAKYYYFLERFAEEKINVRSTKALPTFLYDTLKLPERKNREGNRTADQETLISLIANVNGHIEGLKTEKSKVEWQIKLQILQLIIFIREQEKLLSSYLNIILHEGRAKSMYRVDGTKSGRLSAKKFIDGSGLNIQTIPRSSIEVKT